MSQTLRFVSSVKANLPEVWAALPRARAFVVSPYPSLQAKFDREAELVAGHSILAKLFAGPFALSDPWRVQTNDRDEERLSVHGAEGFDGEFLWDYEILVGEAGPRCILDYRVKLPGRGSLPFGISVGRMFDRRHINMKSMLCSARIVHERVASSGLPETNDAVRFARRARGQKSASTARRCSFITLSVR
jgi:hypothetical protein